MYMQTSNCLIRCVQYCEADSMKLAHHSNYVRWMEEARLACFKRLVSTRRKWSVGAAL